MRTRALDVARLDRDDLATLDAGAGTGFTTQGIVERVRADRVTMLDQSPHQLARSAKRAALGACARVLGDAEHLPFGDDAFDRYVSAGSIEYWPDPQRGVAEAYRVLRPGGVALVAGPVLPHHRVARALAQAWMLFPTVEEYREWFVRAGFAQVEVRELAPDWYRGATPYGVAVTGVKPTLGPPPLVLAPAPAEALRAPLTVRERLVTAGRFAAGSAAGAAFVPIAAALTLRGRIAGRDSGSDGGA